MTLHELIKQASSEAPEGGWSITHTNFNYNHFANLVLLEACKVINETPITGAYTSFDKIVAETQRADCFKAVRKLIIQK